MPLPAGMTAMVLSSIADDQGMPVGVVRVSALSTAGLILAAVAIGAMIKGGRK
jgi:hypothetical protein